MLLLSRGLVRSLILRLHLRRIRCGGDMFSVRPSVRPLSVCL